MTIHNTRYILVSLHEVNSHFSHYPDLIETDERERTIKYVEALLNCPLTSFGKIPHRIVELVSMQHDKPLFMKDLSHINELWHAELLDLVCSIRHGMGLPALLVEHAAHDLIETGEALFTLIDLVIRTGSAQDLDKVSQPAVCESLGRIARLFSGQFDDGSRFYDTEMDSTRIPSPSLLEARLLCLPEGRRDYWLVTVSRV